MGNAVVTVLIAVASLALFGGCFAAALLATRPARPRPASPTPDLGDEPPAVVNLVGNGWELNEDAVEATLLDLAARGAVEVEEAGDGSYQLRLRKGDDLRLTAYEERVLDLVERRARDGVVPAGALTTGPTQHSRGWWRSFTGEVVADAQRRDLSRDVWDA